MFEFMIMTEEMKKKLDPDAYSCIIDKSANIIIWQGYVHWTEREMGFYYERFYIAKDYTKIAFLSYLVIKNIYLMGMSILRQETK